MTRLILAGTGLIGRRHMDHILAHPNLTLAGIIEPAGAPAGVDVPVFNGIEDVDVEADGIVVASPTGTHTYLTIRATERGWHALVEKPIADSLGNADRMISAADANGVHILVGHHRRHHPKTAALKALIDDRRVGQPVVASLLWTMKKPDDYFDPEWRRTADGAPVRMNLIHEIDLLRWYFGEVTEVTGFGSNAVRGAARTESGGAVVAFSSGVHVTVAFADTTPAPWGFEAGTGENPHIATTGQDCLRIACTEGAIEFPSLRVWSGAESWHEAPAPEEMAAPDGVPLIRQLEHFADVIHGRADPLISGRDGRATLAATLLIEEATRPEGVQG